MLSRAVVWSVFGRKLESVVSGVGAFMFRTDFL